MNVKDEREAPLLTNHDDKTQITPIDCVDTKNQPFIALEAVVASEEEESFKLEHKEGSSTLSPEDIGQEEINLESATLEWEEDMRRQDEAVRLQLEALNLFVEDTTMDKEAIVIAPLTIIHEENERLSSPPPNQVEPLDLDKMRLILLDSEVAQCLRLTIFVLLKTLDATLDILSLSIKLIEEEDHHENYIYDLEMEVLYATQLSQNEASRMVESFQPVKLRFYRTLAHDERRQRLRIEVESKKR